MPDLIVDLEKSVLERVDIQPIIVEACEGALTFANLGVKGRTLFPDGINKELIFLSRKQLHRYETSATPIGIYPLKNKLSLAEMFLYGQKDGGKSVFSENQIIEIFLKKQLHPFHLFRSLPMSFFHFPVWFEVPGEVYVVSVRLDPDGLSATYTSSCEERLDYHCAYLVTPEYQA